METTIQKILSPAERHYQNHLKCVASYQKRNPDKTSLKCKKYFADMRKERPEEYALFLEKKRKYYNDITKPKKLAKIQIEKTNLQQMVI